MRTSGLKRPRAHYHRVCRGPQQPHNEPVFFVPVTDLSSFRLAGQIEAHDTVECRHEVCDAMGTFFRSRWKGKISVVSGAKTLREGRFRRLSGLSCEQRANGLHSKKATPVCHAFIPGKLFSPVHSSPSSYFVLPLPFFQIFFWTVRPSCNTVL